MNRPRRFRFVYLLIFFFIIIVPRYRNRRMPPTGTFADIIRFPLPSPADPEVGTKTAQRP